MKKVLLAILSGVACAAVILSVFYFDVVKSVVQDMLRGEIILENEENLYYYNHLSDKEKKAYKKIVDNADEFPEEIRIPYLENDSLLKVLDAVSCDQPEFFYLGNSCQKIMRKNCCYFKADYDYDKDTYTEYKKEQDEKIDHIVSQIDETWSDYEKELFVYDYIITHCTYTKSESIDTYKAYGALVNGKATCEGYARAMQAVLDRLGINNFLVSGTAIDANGETQGHMWNVLEIEGEYYYIDVTWDDPAVQNDYGPSHIYLNLDYNDISRNHYGFEKYKFVCNSTSQNYFIKNGLYFNNYNDSTLNIIKDEIDKAVKNRKDKVEFRFSDNNLLQSAKKSLFDDDEISNALINAGNKYPKSRLMMSFKKVINESYNAITIILSYER